MKAATLEETVWAGNPLATPQEYVGNHVMLLLSEPSFLAVWNDPANDVYDAL